MKGLLRYSQPALLLAFFLFLPGCAQQPQVMRFEYSVAEQSFWPAPPDPPRLAYIGDLTGETNFLSEDHRSSATRTVFKALFGVGLDEEPKKVMIRPQGVTTDAQGRIYVTDVGKQAVFVFDPQAGALKLWSRIEGSKLLKQPIGIAVLPGGVVHVADAEYGEIFRFDPQGNFLGSFGRGLLKRPTGLAYDSEQQRLFVADTHAHDIKVFDERGRLIDAWGGLGSGQGNFNSPVYIAYDDNELFVVDTLNARVQVLDDAGNYKREFGKRGLFVGNLVRPKGVALDSDGNVYIVESYYDYMLIYGQQGRFLLPVGGAGKDAGRFFHPSGIWIDGQDRIYVTDMLNGRVSVFQYLGGDV